MSDVPHGLCKELADDGADFDEGRRLGQKRIDTALSRLRLDFLSRMSRLENHTSLRAQPSRGAHDIEPLATFSTSQLKINDEDGIPIGRQQREGVVKAPRGVDVVREHPEVPFQCEQYR